ncbi:hypothetical protein WMF26_24515 [Sorangium sp. So ce185]|uniref:hypothetical protein n=1 Tax=Sorangium sp. So ce185 TaxID=3133287 RepID=UPI003F5F3A82
MVPPWRSAWEGVFQPPGPRTPPAEVSALLAEEAPLALKIDAWMAEGEVREAEIATVEEV